MIDYLDYRFKVRDMAARQPPTQEDLRDTAYGELATQSPSKRSLAMKENWRKRREKGAAEKKD